MRNVGREVSGAWRSLRYDLSRRPARRAVEPPPGVEYPQYEPAHRPRHRRALAATTFGALSLAGAAGTYFAVVGGLSALASEEVAPPPSRLPAVTGSASPAPTVRGVAPVPRPTPTRTAAAPAGGAAPSPSGRSVLGRAPVRPVPTPTCACVTPPVPTPTSPPPVTESPDPPASSSPPAPTASASPSPTPGASDPPAAGG